MSSECLRTGDKAQVLFRFIHSKRSISFHFLKIPNQFNSAPRFVKHFDKKFFLRFVKHPEYLKEGQRLVFREGRTKAVGNVNKVTKTLDWEGWKCQQGDKHSNICKDAMQIKLVNRIDSICMKSSFK